MTGWRPATPDDALGLRDLERAANLVGLAHVFTGLPFPDDAVLARWEDVLADPDVRVDVVDREGDVEVGPETSTGALAAYAAYDTVKLRHLAVHPDCWGRGLGRAGVARAVAAGADTLWVLEANQRARTLYESLGWTATGGTQACPWPPYPIELHYRHA